MSSKVFLVAGFAIGALSDLLLIRNGLSYSGLTPLDKYPLLWPLWLVLLFLCAASLEWLWRWGGAPKPAGFFSPPLAIVLGMLATQAVMLIYDVIGDPTRHNLWPFEFLFWGIIVAVPVLLGWLLACVVMWLRPDGARG